MNCSECERIKNKKNMVYEDQLVIALLNDKPATGGHILLYPKQHNIILEQLPDELVEHMFLIANKLSVSLFEAIGAHGTNILINNGVASGQKTNHFTINIIPRVENDGLNLQWNPKKQTEDELRTTQMTLQTELEKKEEKNEIKEEPKEEMIEETDEENYLLKQLERTP